MNVTEYIKLCCVKRDDISSRELARRAGITPQNLSNKYAIDKFSNKDLDKIAEALNATLEIKFIDKESGKPII